MSNPSTTTIVPIALLPQYTTESLTRGIDFTPQLSLTGDTFTGTPTVTVSVLSGIDPTPQNILVGTPSLSANSMQIIQRISRGVAGVAYLLSFRCGTAQNNTLEQQGILYIVQG